MGGRAVCARESLKCTCVFAVGSVESETSLIDQSNDSSEVRVRTQKIEDVFELLQGRGRRKARAEGDRRDHLLLSVRGTDVREGGCSTGVTADKRNAPIAIAPRIAIDVSPPFHQSQVLTAV